MISTTDVVLSLAIAVSTRPPAGVVSALRASILSALAPLAGLCTEFY